MSNVVALPHLALFADGRPLPAEEMRSLGAVHVQQRLSLPTLCELIFYDPPGPLQAIAGLAPGVSLRVMVDDQNTPLFSGEVTAVEHVYGPARQREIRVRGYDLLHRLRKRQPVRVHVQTTVDELARELTAGLGLTIEAAAPGPLWRRLIQHRQSDLQLLVELAARSGLYLALRENVLHLLTLAGGSPPLSLTLGESLLEARIDLSGEPACRSVRFAGWDALRVEAHQGQASRPLLGRQVAAAVSPGSVGGDGERQYVGKGLQDNRHADAAAQAELDRRLAYEVTLWGVAEGDPRLRPGTPVVVQGVDSALAGRYVLTAVTHTIDSGRGFLSELSTAPPAPLPSQAANGDVFQEGIAALGIVTQVSDPQGLGRVRVSLPAYQDLETEWMHVLSPGAGPDKGLIALPDVGDRVLVLFTHGDPAQGVVLGGLYGMSGPPDSGVEENAVRRYILQTPGGQRIQLDDVGETIRLEDRTGNYVELSPQKVLIHAARDLELEAPGQAVVISGQSIDFRRA